MKERLQKIIAQAGVASRRNAEHLIRSGQVTVNGKVVKELGSKADPARDHIKVCGKLLQGPRDKVYLALHKPAGVVSTVSDPEGRPTIRQFLHGVPSRVFPIGLLGYHAAGLLLLTNDGDLANRMMQAASRMALAYHLKVKGRLSREVLRAIEQRSGARLRVVREGPNPWYEAQFGGQTERSDGDSLERLANELFAQGHPVEKVRRMRIGDVALGDLAAGHYRMLSPAEVQGLYRRVGGAEWSSEGQTGASENARRGNRRNGRRSALDTRSGRYSGRRSARKGSRK